eukprot:scaffold3968_cov359-Prasinococcus_capsulatus_cf.AAC.3
MPGNEEAKLEEQRLAAGIAAAMAAKPGERKKEHLGGHRYRATSRCYPDCPLPDVLVGGGGGVGVGQQEEGGYHDKDQVLTGYAASRSTLASSWSVIVVCSLPDRRPPHPLLIGSDVRTVEVSSAAGYDGVMAAVRAKYHETRSPLALKYRCVRDALRV